MDTPEIDGMTALHTAADVSSVVSGHVQAHVVYCISMVYTH